MRTGWGSGQAQASSKLHKVDRTLFCLFVTKKKRVKRYAWHMFHCELMQMIKKKIFKCFFVSFSFKWVTVYSSVRLKPPQSKRCGLKTIRPVIVSFWRIMASDLCLTVLHFVSVCNKSINVFWSFSSKWKSGFKKTALSCSPFFFKFHCQCNDAKMEFSMIKDPLN